MTNGHQPPKMAMIERTVLVNFCLGIGKLNVAIIFEGIVGFKNRHGGLVTIDVERAPMWNTVQYYTDRIFNFMLLGKHPAEVMPFYLAIMLIFVFYFIFRMFRGEVK